MTETSLQYQLAELRPEDFTAIPSLNADIAKTKTRTSDGKVLTRIRWYDTKLLAQSLGSYFLPTSSQWSTAREYLQQNNPELEKDFISGAYEWVDSLLAFPNKDKQYSSRLRLPEIGMGKVPLLIEQSKVERSGDDFVITKGKVREVPQLPLKSGYIQAWSRDLGLPTRVGEKPNEKFERAYFWVDTDYSYHEGLRALIRGRWPSDGRVGRFLTDALWFPSASDSNVGFRPGRTGTADEDFVKMSRAEYARLTELSKELNGLLSKVRI